MKTWVAMYLLIWVVFLQMLVIFFQVLGHQVSLGLHGVIGLGVVVLAYYVFRDVRKTECPDRIKRITKSAAYLAIIDGLLGLVLSIPGRYAITGSGEQLILFLHFGIAIASITQASSSATAYDMWEEKEFLPTSSTKT